MVATGTDPPPGSFPHTAKIVVQGGQVISAVLDDTWGMVQQRMIGAASTLEEAANVVEVGFLTNWVQGVNGDSFPNGEVSGQRQWRISGIVNTPDETGDPVRELRVALESDLAFDWVDQVPSPSRPGTLTTMGPPTYEWSFGNVPQGFQSGVAYDAYVSFLQHTSAKAVPGLDLSRSFDQTVFTAAGTQTMTLTITARDEAVGKVNIHLSTWEDDLVDPVFVSIAGAETADCAVIGLGGRTAEICDIPVELNTPVSVTVTIRVTPKVPEVEYKPVVRVSPHRPSGAGETQFGTTQGGSFSYTDEAGTWTVSAEGSYTWRWTANSSFDYDVALDPTAEQP